MTGRIAIPDHPKTTNQIPYGPAMTQATVKDSASSEAMPTLTKRESAGIAIDSVEAKVFGGRRRIDHEVAAISKESMVFIIGEHDGNVDPSQGGPRCTGVVVDSSRHRYRTRPPGR